jgi:peptidoglycan/xylan/chitin deacetylase (PgdA/CDA1 family)
LEESGIEQRVVRAATLLYHDVVDAGALGSSGFQGAGPDRYKLDVNAFQEHLEALDECVSSAPTSMAEVVNGQGLPWLLTFDDGGSSALRIGELLAERRWPAHFFITVDYIGTDGFVSEDEVRALEGMGHVIGSHSCSHPERMAHCSWAQLEEEWRRSVDVLARIVGHPVETASVPGGDYNRTVARAAAAAGIRYLFTSEPVLRARAVDGCSVFGRFSIVRDVPAERAVEFACGSRAPIWSQFTLWQAKKAVKTIGGRHYLKLRRLVLEKRR